MSEPLASFNIVDTKKEIVVREDSRFPFPFYLKVGQKIVVDIQVRNADDSVPVLQTEQGPLPLENFVHYVREITEAPAEGMGLQTLVTMAVVETNKQPGVPILGE